MKYTQDIKFLEKAHIVGEIVGVAKGYYFECSAPCGFISSGWATERAAKDRAKQHAQEHKTGTAMPEMSEFIGDKHDELVMAQRGKN